VTHQVFTYGTLAIPQVMTAVTGILFPTVHATATNHARFLLKGKPYPGMCRRKGAVTFGQLYLDIDEGSLQVMDEFEDDIYVRESIVVNTEYGKVASAWAYLIPDEFLGRLGAECWDQDVFMKRYGETYIVMCSRLREECARKAGREESL
jgi:gamma-glutamylcyclotransferase (GGCT)/AIG2-like uncharacterized protein YtfP